jgi:hypothetical protein
LVAAQPLIREGVVVSKAKKGWNEKDIAKNSNIQVGYYHILANGIEEAISIAKENPEFEFFPSASIEVRQVKTEENETGFKILYIIRQIRNYYKYSFLKGNCPALFSSSHPA